MLVLHVERLRAGLQGIWSPTSPRSEVPDESCQSPDFSKTPQASDESFQANFDDPETGFSPFYKDDLIAGCYLQDLSS